MNQDFLIVMIRLPNHFMRGVRILKKMKLAIIFASFWLIFSASLTTTLIRAETEIEDTTTPLTEAASLEDIIEQKDNTEVTISYALEDKKELILKKDQKDMIDVHALKEELGKDKVKENSDKKELILTLDNPDSTDFTMYVDKEKPFLLSVLKSDGELIFDYQFNELEKYDSHEDTFDDQFEEATWTRVDKPRLSKGPIIEHADGSMVQPYLYFGDYEETIRPGATLEQSWLQRGDKSRQNSLTAPNTAILYAEPGSRIEDGPKSLTNHVYTNHYGDNQKGDYDSVSLDRTEDKPYGTPTSYTSNTLYNSVSRSDDKYRPSISGPNKIGKSYAMVNTPKLYYRVDPRTGFEEQRLVYNQRAKWENRKGKNNPEVTTTIKLSFTKTGRVITHITYKNTGTTTIPKFIGLSNHDLSLNKDGAELRNNYDEKIGNYIPMRALGNKRGMYMQAPNNEIRTSIYVNHPEEPGAWAARSASRSYLATRGYISETLISLLPIYKETYYPWKVGKKQNSGFFDNKENHYIFPYTPKGYNNAFESSNDSGDKDKLFKSGKRLGAEREKDPMWDSGLTLRTNAKDLIVNGTVEMEYSTMTDVPGSTFSPVVIYDYLGTDDEPQVLPLGTKKIALDGHWYDFDSTNVTLYYGIDSKEDGDMQKVMLNGKQSPQDAEVGKFNEFSSEIDIQGLEKGPHKIYLIAIDEDGNKSVMQEHVFNLMDVSNKEPQIAVTSPKGTKKEPYAPISENMRLKGFWSDRDSSKIKSITYQIDDGPELVHSENIKNSKKGSLVKWTLDDLDIKKFNDFDVHMIKFQITDAEGNIGTTEFYFRHIGGSVKLVAPEEIDFGSLSVTPSTNNPIKPNLNDGKVLIEDFREKDSNPISLSLSIDTFYKVDEDDGDDNGDDGDNADGDGDDTDEDGSEEAVPSKADNKPESLMHDVFWKENLVSTKDLIVGKTEGHKNHEWFQTTDFTNEITKNLKLNFRSGENGASIGKYVSHWTWQMIDSID